MIAGMVSNKKLNPIVSELFIRGGKLNISLVLITQSYFGMPKKFETKFYALFYYDNSKKTRTASSCIQQFIRYCL